MIHWLIDWLTDCLLDWLIDWVSSRLLLRRYIHLVCTIFLVCFPVLSVQWRLNLVFRDVICIVLRRSLRGYCADSRTLRKFNLIKKRHYNLCQQSKSTIIIIIIITVTLKSLSVLVRFSVPGRFSDSDEDFLSRRQAIFSPCAQRQFWALTWRYGFGSSSGLFGHQPSSLFSRPWDGA